MGTGFQGEPAEVKVETCSAFDETASLNGADDLVSADRFHKSRCAIRRTLIETEDLRPDVAIEQHLCATEAMAEVDDEVTGGRAVRYSQILRSLVGGCVAGLRRGGLGCDGRQVSRHSYEPLQVFARPTVPVLDVLCPVVDDGCLQNVSRRRIADDDDSEGLRLSVWRIVS